MGKVIKEYTISATPEKVWEALTDPKVIEEWSQAPAVMDEKKDFVFSLWGGEIVGKNTDVVRYRKLTQKWREKAWDEDSFVIIELSPRDGGTHLHLEHSGIPEESVEDIDDGWDSE